MNKTIYTIEEAIDNGWLDEKGRDANGRPLAEAWNSREWQPGSEAEEIFEELRWNYELTRSLQIVAPDGSYAFLDDQNQWVYTDCVIAMADYVEEDDFPAGEDDKDLIRKVVGILASESNRERFFDYFNGK